jgi:hypothetical protein
MTMTSDQLFATLMLAAIVIVVGGLFLLAAKVQNRREREGKPFIQGDRSHGNEIDAEG